MSMRYRAKQRLIICATCATLIICIYLALKINTNLPAWGVFASGSILIFILALNLSYNYVSSGPQYLDENLAHSEDLIETVFDTQSEINEIDYKDDELYLVCNKKRMSSEITTHNRVHSKNEICQLCVEWNEMNPMRKFAIQHLEHKKYKRTWQAYIDGKKYAEIQINKMFVTINQYREIVESHLDNAKLPLKVSENEKSLKIGEYSKKRINHLIFYGVSKKIETGTTNKKLGPVFTRAQYPFSTKS